MRRCLLNRTRHGGKGVIRVRSHQPDRAHYKNQNYRKHDSILGDVLSCLLDPELAQSLHVEPPFLRARVTLIRWRRLGPKEQILKKGGWRSPLHLRRFCARCVHLSRATATEFAVCPFHSSDLSNSRFADTILSKPQRKPVYRAEDYLLIPMARLLSEREQKELSR